VQEEKEASSMIDGNMFQKKMYEIDHALCDSQSARLRTFILFTLRHAYNNDDSRYSPYKATWV